MFRFLAMLLSLAAAAHAATFPGVFSRGLDSLWLTTIYGVKYEGATSTWGFQNGLYFAPTFTAATYGVDGLVLEPHLNGHTPYATSLVVWPTYLDSGGSANHMIAIDVMDVVGGDSSNMALRTRKGHVLLGDTVTAARLLQLGGGLQEHASLIRISRQISADTDRVLVGYPPGGAVMHDTLPLLSQALGQDYWFIQYQTAIDSAWVIVAHAGEKIEGFDSVALKSNIGISYLHLLGQGNRWRVLEHYEEGGIFAILGGVSPSVQDTAWYTLRNLTQITLRFKPLVGTSNAAGTAFSITGLNSNFTDATLDTSWTMTAGAMGYDSSAAVSLLCVAALAGTGISCQKTTYDAFKVGGRKGLRYGAEFTGRLPRPPSHR